MNKVGFYFFISYVIEQMTLSRSLATFVSTKPFSHFTLFSITCTSVAGGIMNKKQL